MGGEANSRSVCLFNLKFEDDGQKFPERKVVMSEVLKWLHKKEKKWIGT